LNGLGGQGHDCEESRQEKGTRRQEEAGQESYFGRKPIQQGEAQVRAQAVEESREVSETHEHQASRDQADGT
jgi:hypothetical protein